VLVVEKTPWHLFLTEATFEVPGHPEPAFVIRRLKLQGVERWRVVTWAPSSEGRSLVGYFDSSDAAAVACWRKYCADANRQHELASRTHGGRERGGPAAQS
jgi:hypothetical protein